MWRTLLLLCLLAPASASAGTVTFEEFFVDGYKGSGYWSSSTVYAAAPGERNVVQVSLEGGVVRVRDQAGLTAATGCTAVSATEAACVLVRASEGGTTLELIDGDDTATIGDGLESATVHGGPGADRLLIAGRAPSFPTSGSLDGGTGDDVLLGGPGDDDLRGGPGDDRLSGGLETHEDNADYEDHTTAVSVDLARGVGGSEGERDVLRGIETAVGGRGDDTLVGDGRANEMRGGRGDDLIRGAGGDDLLYGDDGANRLEGGDGDDSISVAALRDRSVNVLVGGRGADDLSGAGGPDVLIGGPDEDSLAGGRGADRIDARDDGFDEVRCDSSRANRDARVRADGQDLVIECPRVARLRPPLVTLGRVGASFDDLKDGRTAFATLACSSDIRRGCRGTVQVGLRSGPLARTAFSLKPGAFEEDVRLRLPADARERLRCRGRATLRYVLRTRDAAGRLRTLRRTVQERVPSGPLPSACDG